MQIIVDDNNPGWGRSYVTVTIPIEGDHPAFRTFDMAQRGSQAALIASALGHDPRICGMTGTETFVFNKKF